MRTAEHQYLDMLARVLDKGDPRVDRTGVGTRSSFGEMARFDLSDGQAPILTTKRVYWKTAVKEMLWFLTGGTNIRELLADNVRIWTDWPLQRYRREVDPAITQDEFERRIVEDEAFARAWGELGPVYGKQWRRWLGTDGREHDQIAQVIQALRTNPASRASSTLPITRNPRASSLTLSTTPTAAPPCCHSKGTAPGAPNAPLRTTSPPRSATSNTAA